MKEKKYSAGAVKHCFWFTEFRKAVELRAERKTWNEIGELAENNNIFGAPTPLRSRQILNTVSRRVKALDESFYPVFQSSDATAQKLIVLIAVMASDRLFAEFVYEVVREKMFMGIYELTDSDIRKFFSAKQEQDTRVAKWSELTFKRLLSVYKVILHDAGLLDGTRSPMKIIRPLPSPELENWLIGNKMRLYLRAITGEA